MVPQQTTLTTNNTPVQHSRREVGLTGDEITPPQQYPSSIGYNNKQHSGRRSVPQVNPQQQCSAWGVPECLMELSERMRSNNQGRGRRCQDLRVAAGYFVRCGFAV